MSKATVKTVFFDWDRTLAYTKSSPNGIAAHLARMFGIAGLPYSEEQIETAVQHYVAEAGPEKVQEFKAAQTRRAICGFYAQLLKRLGHDDTSWEQLVRIYRAYARLPWVLYDDSRPALEAVLDRGFVVGILSNTSGTARQFIRELVGDLVPAQNVIISEELGVHKPAKTIFIRAAARVRTPPENCLMIGDNLAVDAVGAIENGGFACAIWLDRLRQDNPISLPPRTSTINTLAEVPALLDKI
jgi:putative hydrolase of the HAD superfamily